MSLYANLAAVAAFAITAGAGFGLLHLARNSQAERMRARLVSATRDLTGSDEVMIEDTRPLFSRRRGSFPTIQGIGNFLYRIRAVHPRAGIPVIACLPAATVLATLSIATGMIGLPAAAGLAVSLICAGASALALASFYAHQYRERFLSSFPDALELIVRATRAGVPVASAIDLAGNELPDPLRGEFRLMSDSLKLGIDLAEVVEAAADRIDIPDFTFFAVCIVLQRETGGSLSEALANLADVIRARREIKVKAKALTAESRFTTNALAALPIVFGGGMYLINPSAFSVFLTTQEGQFAAMLAFGLWAIGLGVIKVITRQKI